MSYSKALSWRRMVVASVVVAGFAVVCAFPASAEDAAAFYKGKHLKIVVGSGVGGGYDGYARLLGRHIGDHIPGHPKLVVQNMPGASGIKATNWLYNVAPKDGTVMGATFNNLLIEPLLGDKATRFDPRKFEWIGGISRQYTTCAVWHTSSIHSIQDAEKRMVRVSTTGMTGNSARLPLMLNKLLGTKFKVIAGYSTSGMRLALERGEVEGICGFSYDTFTASNPEWVKDHKIRFYLQTGMQPIKELPGVPSMLDAVKNPTDRAALKVLSMKDEYGRPHMFPPDVPKYLLTAVRRAFDASMKDPKLLADADRMHVSVDPTTGEAMAQAIREAYAAPKAVVARLIELWPPALKKKKKKKKH